MYTRKHSGSFDHIFFIFPNLIWFGSIFQLMKLTSHRFEKPLKKEKKNMINLNLFDWWADWSQIILRSNVFHHHFYLPEADIQVQNCHGVLVRLYSPISWIRLTSKVLHGHFRSVFRLLQVTKNDDKRFG